MEHANRTFEWRRALLAGVASLLAFETLTGLGVWLAPFSITSQVMVVLHTIIGIVCVIPYVWYQWRHWRLYESLRWSHVMLTGYFSMVSALALIVTGIILTLQAALSTRISHGLDLAHILATVALVASVLPHVGTLVVRAVRAKASETAAATRNAARHFGWRTAWLTAAQLALVVLAVVVYRAPKLVNELPKDYSYVYGKDRPFAPSLATTASGGAYDSRLLAGSASCGTAQCHKDIYDEWSVSAHRYAAMDASFQKVQSVMGQQNGPESTRYCGGCHDPISLFSGTKNIFAADLTAQSGYKEGVSCVACHAIEKTDLKGNANFVIAPPKRYMWEMDTASALRPVGDFLIRAYPRYHVASLERKMFKSPEFCAACHKQFIDKEINKVGWVQLQNQYDNWRKSRWNKPGDAAKTIECRECHMPLQRSNDPASGDDKDYNRSPDDHMVRSHRFLAANQFIPTAMHLPGGDEQVTLTEKWLRGQIDIPEIAAKWRTGPAVPIQLLAPMSAKAGAPVELQAELTNNKTGHDFPTGPLDIIQAWVELDVKDQSGKLVYQSGGLDARHFIAPGSFMFKSEPIDVNGNLIDHHNLWEMVGVRYRRAIFPGFSDRGDFRFVAPRGATELHVTARLMYRKIDQFLINFLFGEKSGMTAPVTVMSQDTCTIMISAN